MKSAGGPLSQNMGRIHDKLDKILRKLNRIDKKLGPGRPSPNDNDLAEVSKATRELKRSAADLDRAVNPK